MQFVYSAKQSSEYRIQCLLATFYSFSVVGRLGVEAQSYETFFIFFKNIPS